MSIIKVTTAPPPVVAAPSSSSSGLVPATPASTSTGGLIIPASSSIISPISTLSLGHQPPELAGSDFVVLDEPRKQTTALIFGDNGNGKSSFITRFAPGPVAFINFDKRARYAVRDAVKAGRVVYYTEVDIPANLAKLEVNAAMKAGQTALDKVIKNVEWAVTESRKGNIRTIGIDTGTELHEIMNVAAKGRPNGKDKDYGQAKDWVNRQWWRLFNMAREGNAHLVVLARAKAIWENNEPTGAFTYRGPEVMGDAVDWAAQIRLARGGVAGGVVRKIGAAAPGPKQFELLITKAGVNIEELGETYTSDQWDEYGGPFVYACALQYKGSATEDWE